MKAFWTFLILVGVGLVGLFLWLHQRGIARAEQPGSATGAAQGTTATQSGASILPSTASVGTPLTAGGNPVVAGAGAQPTGFTPEPEVAQVSGTGTNP